MLPIGIMMVWLGYVIGCQYLQFWSNICVAIICGGISYQQCLSSLKLRKNTVSWFIRWNTYGIVAMFGIGFMLAAIYLGGVK